MNKKNLILLLGSSMLVWACQSDKKEDAKEFYSDLFDKQEESAEFALTDEEVSGEVQEAPKEVVKTEAKEEVKKVEVVSTEVVKDESAKVETVEPKVEVVNVISEEKKEITSAVELQKKEESKLEETSKIEVPKAETSNN